MQAVGIKNHPSLHYIKGFILKTSGSLSFGKVDHFRKGQMGSFSFGISNGKAGKIDRIQGFIIPQDFLRTVCQDRRIDDFPFFDVLDIHTFVGFDVADLSVVDNSDVNRVESIASPPSDTDFEACHKRLCLNVLRCKHKG